MARLIVYGDILWMNRRSTGFILPILAMLILNANRSQAGNEHAFIASALRRQIITQYSKLKPTAWSMRVPGVCTQLRTNEKVIALTFDACGGSRKGNSFDVRLIDFLEREQIPATIFLTGRWIDANPKIAHRLAMNPLFEIENHGLQHKPCSVNGRSAYGIRGTASVGEVIDEVEKNAEKIEAITQKKPAFYRSGTAMYDDIAPRIIKDMGYTATGFSISGDGGAKFSTVKIVDRFIHAAPGSIILCHMNHPEGHTAEGVIAAVPILRKKGFKFVRLEQAVKSENARSVQTK